MTYSLISHLERDRKRTWFDYYCLGRREGCTQGTIEASDCRASRSTAPICTHGTSLLCPSPSSVSTSVNGNCRNLPHYLQAVPDCSVRFYARSLQCDAKPLGVNCFLACRFDRCLYSAGPDSKRSAIWHDKPGPATGSNRSTGP